MITPASIRTNNPGAMYPGTSSRKFGSTAFETLKSKDGTHQIAIFPTPVHGAAAQFDLLHSNYCGMSVENAIKKWCGGFYASTYLAVLEQKGGIKKTDILTKDMVKKPEIAVPLARAMAWQEAGRDFPLDESGWMTAHGMAFSGAKAPAFAPDNDVPSPKPETRMNEAVKKALPVAVPAAGVGGTIALPQLPPAPDVSAFSGWQSAMETVAAFGKYLIVNPLLAVGFAAFVAVVFFLPKLTREQ